MLEVNVHNVGACPNTSKGQYKLDDHVLAIGQAHVLICTSYMNTFS